MSSVVTAIVAVFTAIGNWFVSAISDLGAIFYDSTTGLTFVGTLAVIGLGIGIIFLVIGFIQNFLRMRS